MAPGPNLAVARLWGTLAESAAAADLARGGARKSERLRTAI